MLKSKLRLHFVATYKAKKWSTENNKTQSMKNYQKKKQTNLCIMFGVLYFTYRCVKWLYELD